MALAVDDMPMTSVPPDQADRVCVAAILDAQRRHGIPDNLLLAIGLQEAGSTRAAGLTVWPWSVNAAGVGRSFKSPEAAMDWVRDRQMAGVTSIDVGCMQINLRWHPDAFASVEQGFDPIRNVDYAARFLVALYARTGDWMAAAGAYHSFNPTPQGIYLTSLRRNIVVANARIGHFAMLATGVASEPVLALSEPDADYVDPGGPFWSAWLSEQDGMNRRTIYSARDLEPVLPAFLPVL
ncbi:lytic transglycosylase domain-containing protein [Tabrizicola sp. WMC-M-20]|nr:lytic transglycosylase domain-containing protein [Tabrizicola sp. WMC-M-20]